MTRYLLSFLVAAVLGLVSWFASLPPVPGRVLEAEGVRGYKMPTEVESATFPGQQSAALNVQDLADLEPIESQSLELEALEMQLAQAQRRLEMASPPQVGDQLNLSGVPVQCEQQYFNTLAGTQNDALRINLFYSEQTLPMTQWAIKSRFDLSPLDAEAEQIFWKTWSESSDLRDVWAWTRVECRGIYCEVQGDFTNGKRASAGDIKSLQSLLYLKSSRHFANFILWQQPSQTNDRAHILLYTSRRIGGFSYLQ